MVDFNGEEVASKEGGEVIVLQFSAITQGILYAQSWYIEGYKTTLPISHWMPLPPAPERE